MENGKITTTASSSNNSEVIRAYIRVRPPIASEILHENCLQVPTNHDIHLRSEKYDVKCQYDHVFNELSTQQEIFQLISPLLDDILLGYNASIFAYGQTSAGKTHTMIGPNGGQDLNIDKSDWGVIPRASEYLFNHLQERSSNGGFKYIAKASFLQIYNEKLYDLLRTTPPSPHEETELRIREIPYSTNHTSTHGNNNQKSNKNSARKYSKSASNHSKRDHSHSNNHHNNNHHNTSNSNHPCEVFITGLSEFRIQTTEDILRVIRVGTHSRATRSTNSNLTSSRSHAILQLTFEMESIEENGQKMIYKSKLSLIDLAGSEKMVALGNVSVLPSSDHLKELTAINQSLSSLGNVISALASKHRPHIPYRDSKLTRILQDSLGGNTRTILLSCVTPSILHCAETISTLQFTDRAKNVLIKSKANLVIDDKALLSNAQAEISRLKLLLKQALLKIESMSRGVDGSQTNSDKSGGITGTATAVGAGPGSVGDRGRGNHIPLDDGETKEEMERVLRENKQLRRENQLLIKELRDLREAEEGRRRKARERDREKDRERPNRGMVTRDDRQDYGYGSGSSYKREWNLRDDRYVVGEERRKKKSKERLGRKEKLGLPAVNRSQTSPVNTNTPPPVSHPPPPHSHPHQPYSPNHHNHPNHHQHPSHSHNNNNNNNNNKEEALSLPAISPASSSSTAPETYSLPLHRQYKIREALGLDLPAQSQPSQQQHKANGITNSTDKGMSSPSTSTAAVIGSPSKSSLDRLRVEYFLQSEVNQPANRDHSQAHGQGQGQGSPHENENEEDDVEDDFDVKKLREKVQRAKDSLQLKEVEKSLKEATKNIVGQLEIDERSLADIQKSRKELEKQLHEMSQEEENEDEEDDEEGGGEGEGGGARGGDDDSTQGVNEMKLTPTKSSNGSILSNLSPLTVPQALSRQSSLSRLQARDHFQSLASSASTQQGAGAGGAGAGAVGTGGIGTLSEGLKCDRSDVGRRVELYVYRYNNWQEIEIIDYEPTKNLHKCRHVDRTEQWIDLKKKQLREIQK